jgi:hypothetical protein
MKSMKYVYILKLFRFFLDKKMSVQVDNLYAHFLEINMSPANQLSRTHSHQTADPRLFISRKVAEANQESSRPKK